MACAAFVLTAVVVPDLDVAAAAPVADTLIALQTSELGLTTTEAEARLQQFGPNALRAHGVGPGTVLLRQLRNPLLILLLAAATLSGFTGSGTDAVIIGIIVGLSVGLGFINEYRSEQAVAALHRQVRHTALVLRDGTPQRVNVVALVPGDIATLAMGDVVPADLRLLEANEMSCDEAVLTGESLPVDKDVAASEPGRSTCALMGSIVRQGAGRGVVVRTGGNTDFGHIAAGLGEHHGETAFQAGLRDFSYLLVRVAGVLTVSIFVINVILQRPVVEALLFSLAIAIGITPQLLPAIVTVSLSTGSRRLAQRKVLVKRLVSIEDLGNITLLFTDKTGTLTEGAITFDEAIDGNAAPCEHALLLGLICSDATLDGERVVGGNALDTALWESADETARHDAQSWHRQASKPFDHERRMASVLVDDPDGSRWLVVKGEPEGVIARCRSLSDSTTPTLDQLFDRGARVIAVATKPAPNLSNVGNDDESALDFAGFLVFVDRPKADAAPSLQRLATLGIGVKVITGDSERVAVTVCRELGLPVEGSLTGAAIDALDDAALTEAIGTTTVFARVGPETKARIVKMQRKAGADVAFMGDGVNDALALHHADVGISVESGTDVAKDAADIILLDKDLGVLADGVAEGRRIFANTIKYILMATSSNFGNMFSAAGASIFLSFLPMLPSQILLNNVLYDAGQMTIPTDNVDEEMLARPSAWDLSFIKRFMAVFGPISSIFDFATFGILLWVLHATTPEFRTGWFVESLATQSFVIFVIRTRRLPFWRSRPSTPLLLASITVPFVGIALTYMPFGTSLGFTHLPLEFFPILLGLVVTYLALVEVTKYFFYRALTTGRPLARHRPHAVRRVRRRAARFTTTRR